MTVDPFQMNVQNSVLNAGNGEFLLQVTDVPEYAPQPADGAVRDLVKIRTFCMAEDRPVGSIDLARVDVPKLIAALKAHLEVRPA